MSDLCSLLRPSTLDGFVGQSNLLSKGRPLRELIEKNSIPHAFFFGPPGTGKTTLARIIAKSSGAPFFELNATSLKIEEIRKIIERYTGTLQKPLLFIDEVHRLSKTQQEVLLPVMENSLAIVIGASTENPFFALTGGIRSRSFLFEFLPLTKIELQTLLDKAAQQLGIILDDDAAEYLLHSSAGDARAMLNLLDYAAKISTAPDRELLSSLRPHAASDGSSSADTHYNLASALIKSVRGSDPDAAIYYLARLIDGGEEPRFLARRLLILASEDIGNANPNALVLASAAFTAVEKLGYPEARIVLSQLAIYLACSPKSNTAIVSIDDALYAVQNKEILEVPNHLKDAHYEGAKKLGYGKGYRYPHDFGGWVAQKYLSKPLRFVTLKEIAHEKRLKEWLQMIQKP